jgi:N utilization substance protein A
VLDEDAGKIEVVVPTEQLSLAIGRRGQNVRLASMLTGWEIDILTEHDESERRQAEFRTRSENFITALDVEDVIAHLLVTEGFTSVEEVAFVPIDELASIEGFDEEIATELQRRANTYLEAESERLTDQARELGVQEDLVAVEGLTPAMLVTLGERGVKTLEDFADLATDEVTDPAEGLLREYGLAEENANDIIMRARVAAGWFTQEELDATRAAEAARREAEAAAAEGESETAASDAS